MRYCQWFSKVEAKEVDYWGEEAWGLSQISRSGASLAPGFVVSRQATDLFFLDPKLRSGIQAACKGLSIKQPHHFAGVAKEIRQLILRSKNEEFSQQIQHYFQELREQLLKKMDTSLRMTVYGGGQELSEVIKDSSKLVSLIQKLYALGFEEKSLYLRLKRGESIVPETYPVIIEVQEKPEFSGLAYVHDPLTHDDLTIQIQAYHQASPKGYLLEDLYRIDKKSLTLLSRNIQKKWWTLDPEGGYRSPSHLRSEIETLSDEQAINLARQIKMAQNKFKEIRSFSWVYQKGQFCITRVTEYKEDLVITTKQVSRPLPLLIGVAGGLGWINRPARLIKNKKDRLQLKDGEIAVVEKLQPDDYRWLAGVSGIISETGGLQGIEKEIVDLLGVPAVLATGTALSSLRNGQMVSLDGTHGLVYAGVVNTGDDLEGEYTSKLPVTGVKIYATINDPQRLKTEKLLESDGVGMLRTESIIKMLSTHPQDIIQKNLDQEYVEILAENIEKAARSVYPKPMVYQLDDFKPEDFHGFRASHHDRYEPNPTIGYRGTHRLLSEPHVLDLELRALELVLRKGLSNYSIMLPMVRSLDEVKRAMVYIRESKYCLDFQPEIWVKCETPALIILIEQLCELDIAGVCFDVPALAQLLSGIDQANYQVAHHLDHASQALKESLAYALSVCREAGISSMLISEDSQLRPEIIQVAVEAGVTAISVHPEDLMTAHGLVASIERKMILDNLIVEEK